MIDKPSPRLEFPPTTDSVVTTFVSEELEVPQGIPVEMIGTYQETYAVLYGLFKSSSLDLGTSDLSGKMHNVTMHVTLDIKKMPFYEQAKAKLLETYKSLFDITIIEEDNATQGNSNRNNALIVASVTTLGFTIIGGLAAGLLADNNQPDSKAATVPHAIENVYSQDVDDGVIVCEALRLTIPAGNNRVNASVIATDDDPDFSIIGYEINFGDGAGPQRIEGKEIEYVFDSDGSYAISASVLAETEWGSVQRITSPDCSREVDLPMPIPPPPKDKVEATDASANQDSSNGINTNNKPKEPQMNSDTGNTSKGGGTLPEPLEYPEDF